LTELGKEVIKKMAKQIQPAQKQGTAQQSVQPNTEGATAEATPTKVESVEEQTATGGEEKKPKWWMILAIIIAVIVIGTIAYFVIF